MSNANDKVYTPDFIVDEVVSYMEEHFPNHRNSKLLEPFAGEGAFLSRYDSMDWCEIDKGVDFLDYQGKVDWIITNPPYSVFDVMLEKMLQVSDNIAMVIPYNKLMCSMPRLMDIKRAGKSITHVRYLGSGRQMKFPFGFPVALIIIENVKCDTPKTTYSDRCYKSKRKSNQ